MHKWHQNEDRQNFAIFNFNWIFLAVKGYILIGLNGYKYIHNNFNVIMTFKDDLVSNVSLRW